MIVIAQHVEEFITSGFNHLLFKDSFNFLSSSLEHLVKINKHVEMGLIIIDDWQTNFSVSNQKQLREKH